MRQSASRPRFPQCSNPHCFPQRPPSQSFQEGHRVVSPALLTTVAVLLYWKFHKYTNKVIKFFSENALGLNLTDSIRLFNDYFKQDIPNSNRYFGFFPFKCMVNKNNKVLSDSDFFTWEQGGRQAVKEGAPIQAMLAIHRIVCTRQVRIHKGPRELHEVALCTWSLFSCLFLSQISCLPQLRTCYANECSKN